MMFAVDWAGVGLGTLGSGLVAVLLWLVLPRGVVLTKSRPVQRDHIPPDAWNVQNDSSVPAAIVRVTVTSPKHLDGVPLPVDGLGSSVSLTFDDAVLDTARSDNERDWPGIVVPPGETLMAVVRGFNTMTIDYRRSGRFGVFERRSLVIHGHE